MIKTDAAKASLLARKKRAHLDLLDRAAENRARREATERGGVYVRKTMLKPKRDREEKRQAQDSWYGALGMPGGNLPDLHVGGASVAWGDAGAGGNGEGLPGGQFSLLAGEGSQSPSASHLVPKMDRKSAFEGSDSVSMDESYASGSRHRGDNVILPPGIHSATSIRGDKPLSEAHRRAIAAAVNGAIPQGVFVDHHAKLQKSSVAATVNAMEVFGSGPDGMGLSFMRTDAGAAQKQNAKQAAVGDLPEFDKEKADRVANHIQDELDMRKGESEAMKYERSRGDSVASMGSDGGGSTSVSVSIATKEIVAQRKEEGEEKSASTNTRGSASVTFHVATTADEGGASIPMEAAHPQTRERVSLAWRSSPWGRLKAATESMAATDSYDSLGIATAGLAAMNAGVTSTFGKVGDGSDGPVARSSAPRNPRDKPLTGEEVNHLRLQRQLSVINRDLATPIKVPKLVVPKVRVWPKEPKEHYKFKYSWIPQPLLHKAANMVYKDRGLPKAQVQAKKKKKKGQEEMVAPSGSRAGGSASMAGSRPGGMFLTAQEGEGSYDDYDDDDGLGVIQEESSHIYPGPPSNYSAIKGMHAKAFAH